MGIDGYRKCDLAQLTVFRVLLQVITVAICKMKLRDDLGE